MYFELTQSLMPLPPACWATGMYHYVQLSYTTLRENTWSPVQAVEQPPQHGTHLFAHLFLQIQEGRSTGLQLSRKEALTLRTQVLDLRFHSDPFSVA